jgi:hypothetical protein
VGFVGFFVLAVLGTRMAPPLGRLPERKGGPSEPGPDRLV